MKNQYKILQKKKFKRQNYLFVYDGKEQTCHKYVYFILIFIRNKSKAFDPFRLKLPHEKRFDFERILTVDASLIQPEYCR